MEASLSKAFKSFLGYLEGTGKSPHTIKSYRLDLMSFFDFAQKTLKPNGTKPLKLLDLTPKLIESYSTYLLQNKFKPNSQRRMLFTTQVFLNYQTKRKKLPLTKIWKTPTPPKVEKIPRVLTLEEFQKKIQLKTSPQTLSEFDLRNRVMAQVLFETGCLVSELTRLKFDDLVMIDPKTPALNFQTRTVPISKQLLHEIKLLLSKKSYSTDWIFIGFDRGGPSLSASAISHRGVEILIKNLVGVPPRSLRHSAAVHWITQQKASRKTVQTQLGLKTNYSLKFYEPWFEGNAS